MTGLFGWPIKDARGWIGFGTYLLALAVIALLAFIPSLRQDEFFKTIATLIVGAYIKDVVGWAFQANKSSSELSATNARIVENQMAGAGGSPADQNEDAK